MSRPHAGIENAADAALARSMAKLWPHREHESNSVKAMLCACGLHRWRQLNLDDLLVGKLAGKEVQHCFWCSRVRVDGVVYED